MSARPRQGAHDACTPFASLWCPVPPSGVVRPNDPRRFADAMAICARHGVPVVIRGGMTGLAGGAQPLPGWIAISFERFAGIEEIDPASATMTVRAGTFEVIQRAADEAGFFVPLDLGRAARARSAAAISAPMPAATASSRYGMARDVILGLEYVLPDGTLVTGLNKMIKEQRGL